MPLGVGSLGSLTPWRIAPGRASLRRGRIGRCCAFPRRLDALGGAAGVNVLAGNYYVFRHAMEGDEYERLQAADSEGHRVVVMDKLLVVIAPLGVTKRQCEINPGVTAMLPF